MSAGIRLTFTRCSVQTSIQPYSNILMKYSVLKEPWNNNFVFAFYVDQNKSISLSLAVSFGLVNMFHAVA